MEFPSEIVRIISEYSKPMTRPDWRKVRNICMSDFYQEIMRKNIKKVFLSLRFKIIQRIKRTMILRKHIQNYGFKSCSQKYGIDTNILLWIFNN